MAVLFDIQVLQVVLVIYEGLLTRKTRTIEKLVTPIHIRGSVNRTAGNYS